MNLYTKLYVLSHYWTFTLNLKQEIHMNLLSMNLGINLSILNLFTMGLDNKPFNLNLDLNLWYETWLKPLDMDSWLEPLDMNLVLVHLIFDLTFDPQFETTSHHLYTRHGGSMFVSLMHRWHDSRVGEWWPIPSQYLTCYGDEDIWPTGAYGCILDLFTCFDGYIMILLAIYILGDWWCVRYTSFTSWELATPTLGGIPSYYTWYPEVSPPDAWLLDYLTWLDTWLDLGSWWITDLTIIPLYLYTLHLYNFNTGSSYFGCTSFMLYFIFPLSYIYHSLLLVTFISVHWALVAQPHFFFCSRF